ncbi:MAG: STAS domain-containing protein [Fibrobacter sp.]|nr:STAS domain-containing protein [Fibrobacter sp.]
MQIESSLENGALKVALDGRLDSTTADELGAFFEKNLDDKFTNIILDFEKIDFVSSKGIRVIVAAYKKLGGRPISIVNSNSSVKEVFRLSGLFKVFDVK